MLVLSCKKNEGVVIDDGRIIVRVVAILGNKVRLGIEAPKDVPIHREKVAREVKTEEIPWITAVEGDA